MAPIVMVCRLQGNEVVFWKRERRQKTLGFLAISIQQPQTWVPLAVAC